MWDDFMCPDCLRTATHATGYVFAGDKTQHHMECDACGYEWWVTDYGDRYETCSGTYDK